MIDAAIRSAALAATEDLPEDLRRLVLTRIVHLLRILPERFALPGTHNPDCQVWGHSRGEMRRLATAIEEATRDAP